MSLLKSGEVYSLGEIQNGSTVTVCRTNEVVVVLKNIPVPTRSGAKRSNFKLVRNGSREYRMSHQTKVILNTQAVVGAKQDHRAKNLRLLGRVFQFGTKGLLDKAAHVGCYEFPTWCVALLHQVRHNDTYRLVVAPDRNDVHFVVLRAEIVCGVTQSVLNHTPSVSIPYTRLHENIQSSLVISLAKFNVEIAGLTERLELDQQFTLYVPWSDTTRLKTIHYQNHSGVCPLRIQRANRSI